jgi:hypothetical protein
MGVPLLSWDGFYVGMEQDFGTDDFLSRLGTDLSSSIAESIKRTEETWRTTRLHRDGHHYDMLEEMGVVEIIHPQDLVHTLVGPDDG